MADNSDSFIEISKATVQEIIISKIATKDLRVDILRLDRIHPVVSGNKWFKLKNYLQEAREQNAKTVMTFGGAWSNHIVAAAFACKSYGFNSIGVIRGKKPAMLSQTLQNAQAFGMTLEFVSREAYRHKNEDIFKENAGQKFGEVYFIPEGGAGKPGINGSKEILDLAQTVNYSHILCCMGTGTMFTGIVQASTPQQQILGIPVLKGIEFDLNQMGIGAHDNATIIPDYHFGGYARKTNELVQSMNRFYLDTGIPTDFVYTGKLVFALYDLIKKNYFKYGSKILVIHSGGLQGNASLPAGTLLF